MSKTNLFFFFSKTRCSLIRILHYCVLPWSELFELNPPPEGARKQFKGICSIQFWHPGTQSGSGLYWTWRNETVGNCLNAKRFGTRQTKRGSDLRFYYLSKLWRLQLDNIFLLCLGFYGSRKIRQRSPKLTQAEEMLWSVYRVAVSTSYSYQAPWAIIVIHSAKFSQISAILGGARLGSISVCNWKLLSAWQR